MPLNQLAQGVGGQRLDRIAPLMQLPGHFQLAGCEESHAQRPVGIIGQGDAACPGSGRCRKWRGHGGTQIIARHGHRFQDRVDLDAGGQPHRLG